MSKVKPENIGKVSACRRHKTFVAECHRCNIEAHGEKHTDNARKRHVIVPIQRKVLTNSNKYNSSGEVIDRGLPEESIQENG